MDDELAPSLVAVSLEPEGATSRGRPLPFGSIRPTRLTRYRVLVFIGSPGVIFVATICPLEVFL